jgi:hypothetical protein
MTVERKSGIELLEESVDLLRRTPASAWSWYLAGAAPFFGALLIFWSRMTGVTAVPDPLAGALLLAFLFGWRQYTRAYFAGELYRMLAGSAPTRHSLSALAAAWLAGILRIPLLLVPFPTVIALFRNVAVIAPRATGPTAAFSRAAALATRGSEQIPALLTVVLASLIIWINVFSGMLALPMLLRIFTGQDTILMRNLQALLNGTTMLASMIVAWCIVDVVLAAFYALRVFYGESEETGADLLGSWRRALARTATVAAIMFCAALSLRAAEPVKPDLNHAIDQVLKEKPYQWREPLPNPDEQNAFVRWTDNLLRSLKQSFEAVKRGWAEFVDWLRNAMGSRPARKSNTAPPIASLRAISWLVIVALAGALVALLFRSKLFRVRPGSAPALPAGPVAIDLADPSVLASQLPENEWIAMARDFTARGDFRMALRAYFLASLAFLASRELLAIGRSKTNLDYLREVRRRARSVSGLDALFAGGIQTFESAWYGLHDVGDSDVNHFASNFEQMRGLL